MLYANQFCSPEYKYDYQIPIINLKWSLLNCVDKILSNKSSLKSSQICQNFKNFTNYLKLSDHLYKNTKFNLSNSGSFCLTVIIKICAWENPQQNVIFFTVMALSHKHHAYITLMAPSPILFVLLFYLLKFKTDRHAYQ